MMNNRDDKMDVWFLMERLFSHQPEHDNIYKCKVLGVTSEFGLQIVIVLNVEIDLGFGVKKTQNVVLENIVSSTANSTVALDWLKENVVGKDNVYLCCKDTSRQYPQVHLMLKPDRSETFESINELLISN